VDGAHYFGGTKFKDGKMVEWVKKNATPGKADDLKKVIIALSAEAKLKSQLAPDKADADLVKQGRALISGDLACTDCHSFGKKDPDATGPDLTGYASRAWLMRFISNLARTSTASASTAYRLRGQEDSVRSKSASSPTGCGRWYVPPKGEALSRSETRRPSNRSVASGRRCSPRNLAARNGGSTALPTRVHAPVRPEPSHLPRSPSASRLRT
jgi:hypothetical protein